MKQLVVAGSLALVGAFAACGQSSRERGHGRGGAPPDGNAGEGGESPGGLGGTTGGSVAGAGGRAGVGGRSGGRAGAGASGGAPAGAAGASGVAGSAGASGNAGSGAIVPCGMYDCAKLPHVRPGAAVECRGGGCYIPPDGCEEGFAHCSMTTSVGCEADLTSVETCGSCSVYCQSDTPLCAPGANGYSCVSRCKDPAPDVCRGTCTNLQSDPLHCGACQTDCTTRQVLEPECTDGACTGGTCSPGYGDCDTQFGCETPLDQPMNCGACGRDDCGAEHATLDCSSTAGCAHPICDPGYGNCERGSLDCEATYGASCFPHYDFTRRLALNPSAVAVAADGTSFLAGSFSDTLDFDMSVGVDSLTPLGGADSYLTRFDASGAYAWTRSFGGSGHDYLAALAVTPNGELLVGGSFEGSVDLDPGPGEDVHDSQNGTSWFVSKLSASGNLVWARVFAGRMGIAGVAGDASGALYAAGQFSYTVDFNPGSGSAEETSPAGMSAFLVKLDAGGAFAWVRRVSGNGSSESTAVSVASDGSVWSAGEKGSGSADILGRPLEGYGSFLASFESNGAPRVVAVLSNGTLPPTLAAGTGVVHIGATFSAPFDADLGSGLAERVTPLGATSHFTASYDLQGAYRDAHVWPENASTPVAATPGGGLLTAVAPASISAFYGDGVSAWTLTLGGDVNYLKLSSSTAYFIVTGAEGGSGDADFDPGPGVDPIPGPAQFLSRYSF